MRITGLATGMDMDNVIKESMKPYQIKIDQTTQKKDVVEIKQKLYRDIIKDSREFFSKNLDVLKSDSLLRQSNWSAIGFTSSNESAVTAKANGGAIRDNYTIDVTQLATKATTSLKNGDIITGEDLKITVGTTEANITAITDTEKNNPKLLVDRINKELSNKTIGITAKYSEISGGIVFESKTTGSMVGAEKNEFSVTTSGGINLTSAGKDLIATIKGSNGEIKYGTAPDNISGNNTVTVDGITFNFNQECTGVTLTAKTDSKDLKDKVVAFVNDYNKLIEKLNTTVTTKHDRTYLPLTADQKKEMSETEVKLWNERVEKGQLYRDSDVTRIASAMKETMRSLMSDSGLNLEKVGINPVKDYSGNLNGTFTIDEEKLTQALENNTEDVMNLFIGNSDSTDKSQRGILHQLKDTIDTEFMKSSSSPLLKKAGFEGTSTFSTNELSKSMTDYEKKIKDMQTNFSRREQALYSKFATLEKMMNKLNSQQSNLMSQLGLG
ncbi:flagellar filament capping protein FliD [Clostridium weizhouense]|uniref:Flagellar hook-associated protein 2 n=1 Tax=Clostridium weizhouense TaxID=2859781 RepID=A0ABS7AJI9_9CLOT|nr:flagellar filament capping protein FliD [Clostridium weizhouense]MBW6408581.1 flagellar filament capping protein FliD [Clostridium weizhouense]